MEIYNGISYNDSEMPISIRQQQHASSDIGGITMFRKLLCLALACALLCSTALAFDYSYDYYYGNEATFETLEEARVNGPIYLSEQIPGRVYLPDPAMDAYPEGTTYIYRSAETLNGNTAACRKNTNLLVYTEESFEDKADALAYLENLGLTDLINEAHGSIVLVTPITAVGTDSNGGKTGGFGLADVAAYSLLQAAMCNVYFSLRTAGNADYYADYTYFYADSAYYGGITYRYLIGIDGGATFINNYIAPLMDDIGRIAGMLLVGGSVDKIYNPATFVPAYLINPTDLAVEKYKAANQVDSCVRTADCTCFYNAAQPMQRVAVSAATELTKDVMDDVYHNFLIQAMRIPCARENIYSNGQFTNYKFNQAPYSLFRRNAIIGDRLARGDIRILEVKDTETFKDIITPDGFYMDVWYELLPESVLDNTAPEHSVPLLLGIHGGSDHPLQFLDECGFLDLMGDEQFAIVAPCHQNFYNDADVLGRTLAASVEYMLDKYPALDPSRVYATGYSKGGGSTVNVGSRRADLFAAIMPMAAGGSYVGTEEEVALLNKIGMPIMMFTSRYDVGFAGSMVAGYQNTINRFLGYNGLPTIDHFDFDTYPISGFAGDIYRNFTINGEKEVMQWQLCAEDGTPRVGYNFTEENIHALYPGYGYIAWDFAKHFSRNQETGMIEYHADVK